MDEFTKLRYIIAFRKSAWVFYGASFIWIFFDYDAEIIPVTLWFLIIVYLEANLVEWDFAIENKKEELESEHPDRFDWL